jgi:hypothetical protein
MCAGAMIRGARARILAGTVWCAAVAVSYGGTLHSAVLSNDLFRVSEILTHADPRTVNAGIGPGVTPLHLAAARNATDIAALLIRRGAELEARTDGGFTPLHWAAGRDAADTAALLLARGADSTARTESGITPLHWAALRNGTNVVTLFLRHTGKQDAATAKGMTPLHWAMKSDAAEAAILMAYSAVSADMEREEATGVTPHLMLRDALGVTNDYATTPPAVSTSLTVRAEDVLGKPLTVPLGRGEAMEFIWLAPLGLWMGRTEVTNGEFRRYRPAHSSRFRDGYSLDDPRQPAAWISWVDARGFAAWMNRRYAVRLPAGWGFRLPTAAEWEAAACCGDARVYPWGSGWPPRFGNYADAAACAAFGHEDGITDYADGHVVACPVDESGVNAWGLYGLGGNVWEWAADWLDENRVYKVRLGGAWDVSAEADLRLEARGFDLPTVRDDTIGFRLVIARPPNAQASAQ